MPLRQSWSEHTTIISYYVLLSSANCCQQEHASCKILLQQMFQLLTDGANTG